MQGQWVLPPPPAKIDGEEKYPVSNVKDSQKYPNQLQYVILCTVYGSLTSVPSKFADGAQVVRDSHHRYLEQLGPLEDVLGGS